MASTAPLRDDQRELDAQNLEGEETESVAGETASRRYPALQTISGAFRILGWITLLLGVGGSAFSAAGAASQDEANAAVALGILVGGVVFSVITGVILLALADIILVIIDIERNTRAMQSGEATG